MALEYFKVLAQASEHFDDYLYRVHGGTEADLAMKFQQLDDERVGAIRASLSYTMGTLKDKRRQERVTYELRLHPNRRLDRRAVFGYRVDHCPRSKVLIVTDT